VKEEKMQLALRMVTSPTVSHQLELRQLPWLVKLAASAWNGSTAPDGSCCSRFLLEILVVGSGGGGGGVVPAAAPLCRRRRRCLPALQTSSIDRRSFNLGVVDLQRWN
jgi:hypothetical protein